MHIATIQNASTNRNQGRSSLTGIKAAQEYIPGSTVIDNPDAAALGCGAVCHHDQSQCGFHIDACVGRPERAVRALTDIPGVRKYCQRTAP